MIDEADRIRARRWHVVYVPEFRWVGVPKAEQGAAVYLVTAFDDRDEAVQWAGKHPQHEVRENPDWAG